MDYQYSSFTDNATSPFFVDMWHNVIFRINVCEINSLFTEIYVFADLLFLFLIWSLCRGIICGNSTIKDQTTGEILDRWATRIAGYSWDAKIKSARELLVHSDRVLQFIGKNDCGPRDQSNEPSYNVAETLKVKEKMSPAVRTVNRFNYDDEDEDVDKDVTGSSSGVKGSTNTARRRKKKERGYLIGSQAVWQ